MNAVDDFATPQDQATFVSPVGLTTKRLLEYLPPPKSRPGHFSLEFIQFEVARDIVATYDHIFDR